MVDPPPSSPTASSPPPAAGAPPAGRLPAAFFGHGSPMNALEPNHWTQAWQAFGASVGRPRAILMVSAHWYINASAVTAMAAPRTIHDFFGFSDELFAFTYPAPGSDELVERVIDVAAPLWIGKDIDSWGIDHGTWSVLCHAFPAADVPVVQLSVDASKPFAYHVELGAKLAPLREEGVLILASGNIVHNLPMLDFSAGETGFGWAIEFDEHVRDLMGTDPSRLRGIQAHELYEQASPTPDHFLPLAYLAGLAEAAGATAVPFTEGYLAGSLSMTSLVVR